MAYEVVMPYHLHMPSYFLETFTEYPFIVLSSMTGQLLWTVLLPYFLIAHHQKRLQFTTSRY